MGARLYWLTGLAGAGKSTIGRALYARLRAMKPNVVLLDGDHLRGVFAATGYTLEERAALAFQYARLAGLLTAQGIDVVCATISMFEDCRAWIRSTIPGYCEVYVRTPMHVLLSRDQKELYSRAHRAEISNVVGVDLPFEEPQSPHVVLNGDGAASPESLADHILAAYPPD